MNDSLLSQLAAKETQEKRLSPDKTRQIQGDAEHGLLVRRDAPNRASSKTPRGELRPQSFEEVAFALRLGAPRP